MLDRLVVVDGQDARHGISGQSWGIFRLRPHRAAQKVEKLFCLPDGREVEVDHQVMVIVDRLAYSCMEDPVAATFGGKAVERRPPDMEIGDGCPMCRVFMVVLREFEE